MSRTALPPSPALKLLWEAARARGRPGGGERLRQACRFIEDWSEVAPLARRHRLSALVSDGLARAGAGGVPAEALAELSRDAGIDRRGAFALAMELGALAGRFGAAGIAVMPLKGPLLAARLFGDLAARQVRDLDLMVRLSDAARAHALLVNEGYAPNAEGQGRVPWSALCRSAWQREAVQRAFHHAEYSNPERRTYLELHWSLAHWSGADIGALWEVSREGTAAGAPIRELDDEYLLALLCGHGAQHLWFRLKWLVDVAALLDQLAPERLELALEVAARFRRDRAVAQARLLCSWLDGASAVASAPGTRRELRLVTRLADRAVLALDGAEGGAEGSRPSIGEWPGIIRYHASATRQRLPGYLWRHALVRPADWQTLPLPEVMHPAYRLLRPLLFVGREIKRTRVARRGTEMERSS
jgi:hypothetical protein